MLRRQWGVPAFSSRKALATSGTIHCTKFPKVESDWLPRGNTNDMAAYVAMVSSHTDRNVKMEREEYILVLQTSLGGKPAKGPRGFPLYGLRITRIGSAVENGFPPLA